MTDFVKLILKQKNRGGRQNENFGSSSFFKGGPVGICFASWKKSDWFLPPQHIKKMRESLIFFPNLNKNFLHNHSGKEVKHDMKKLRFPKKTQWTQNLHVTENWVSRPWNGSWKKQNVFWKAELNSDMTDKVVFQKSKFKAT